MGVSVPALRFPEACQLGSLGFAVFAIIAFSLPRACGRVRRSQK